MNNLDKFLSDYLDLLFEGTKWEPDKRLKTNELLDYWKKLVDSKLGGYGLKINLHCQNVYSSEELSETYGTEYVSDDKKFVKLILNTHELCKKFGVDTMPEIFNKMSVLFAKLIHQQILCGKYDKLTNNYGERLKELGSIRQASILLGNNSTYDIYPALRQICDSLPNAMQYPQYAVARICYGNKVFKTDGFEPCGQGLIKTFKGADDQEGSIEVYYKKSFPNPSGSEDPFLIEEHYLLSNLAVMITGATFSEAMRNLKKFNSKRMQELDVINKTTEIIKEGREIDYTLTEICNLLPQAMQFPRHACARIRFDGKEYISNNFIFTHRSISEQFVSIDSNKGSIEVFYTKHFQPEDVGPFLNEEVNLLTNIARLTVGYINDTKGRDILHKTAVLSSFEQKEDHFRRKLTQNHKPLQNYFNQQMLDKYIYLDMMKYKIKHVLFVATLYDAFCLETEDSFFDRFMGDVHQFSLYTLPRITGVSTDEDAIDAMESANIDMVIIMPTADPQQCVQLSEKLRKIKNNVPVFLLINKKEEVKKYEEYCSTVSSIDKIYTWNGDSNIFFTIVKCQEDSINVENDTQIGLVKVILLIEDSSLFYSKYLELLYDTVFGQVAKLIPEVEKNELDKIVKMRSRPKILHARNYEEAITIFNKYKNNLLCVISDVEFEWGGKIDKQAGVKFVQKMRSMKYTVPVIFQSTEELTDLDTNIYREEKVFFINKNSESLLDELKRYLIKYLGYGDFLFKNWAGDILGIARSLREFELMVKQMPADSLYRHAIKNQFSIWLMGRGEIQLAKIFHGLTINSLEDVERIRPLMIKAINQYRTDKKRGKILSFDETSSIDERNIITLAPGSLGGKGRGLAFIDTVIYNLEDSPLSDRINILAPVTCIVGTTEFLNFIAHNDLLSKIVNKNISYDQLKEYFYNGHLSDTLRERIKTIISQTDNPLAIRSSSTSEDSVSQPFAGVFSTYILPNEKDKKEETLELVCHAIKLIYASMYSETARNYYNVVQHNIEEEKMAIIIQEVVGSRFGKYFYPHISGVAQSYNFYPVANMKPEEGYAVAGVGLGCYVVGGWPSYRFSPKYPNISMYTKNDLLKSTQTKFYALDLSLNDVDLLHNGEYAALKLLNIYDAEKHGSLKHLASVYNPDNDSISPGLDEYGPRIVNFADILQYNYFPLAETIELILKTVKDAFGSAVEIEYAVNLNKTINGKPSFYLLQIKPMVGSFENKNINLETENTDNMLLYTNQSLGNGVIDNITDVIYIDESKFSKLETVEMQREINYLNTLLSQENRKYVLIGPGRWGTSDRFLGVPVQWSEISNASVIIETSLEGYPLDFSHGSHFFHNITSMNIGYFAIKKENRKCFLRREILEQQELINKTKYYKHVRFQKPLNIIMNGSKNESAIIFNQDEK
ncbi:MAG: pyruvate, phosphate dikinase [Bacteroidales bacterium]|nr:pyruvate, phosphate dikinase [Bacteroidales bacterium]